MIVFIGLLLNVFGYTGAESAKVLDEKQGKQIAAHTFVIYRHTNAYAAVCRKEGYELQQYPKEFRASFGTEIDELFRKLAPYGISLAELERDLVDEEAARAIEKSVYDEL